MKNGNKNLVTSLSFLIPLFSVICISIWFSEKIYFTTWVAAFFLICGAFLSYKSVKNKNL